jgi:rhamnulokinase
MADAVRTYCKKQLPFAEVCAVVYLSLVKEYAKTAEQIENLSGEKFDVINIIGGGSKDEYLSELTAKICKKKVVAGPSEATSIGNIMSQMIQKGELKDIEEARSVVMRSFSVKEYV